MKGEINKYLSLQCQAQITPIYNFIWLYDFDPELKVLQSVKIAIKS